MLTEQLEHLPPEQPEDEHLFGSDLDGPVFRWFRESGDRTKGGEEFLIRAALRLFVSVVTRMGHDQKP